MALDTHATRCAKRQVLSKNKIRNPGKEIRQVLSKIKKNPQ
jgi:hypothetical protein